MAGSTSAITLSSAADSVPNDDTSASCSRPTVFSAVSMTSAGEASRKRVVERLRRTKDRRIRGEACCAIALTGRHSPNDATASAD